MQNQDPIKPESATELPPYETPQITVYNQEELLRNVAVFGCSPFDTN